MKRALVWVAVVVLVLLGHLFGGKNLRGALDTLPALIAALVGWLFARTLCAGRTPLIARAIAAIDGPRWLDDPAVAAYARRLTAVWAVWQFALAACAALLGCELTLPDVSQTLILTRYASKTRMPEGEALGDLARHRATMAIHLGVSQLAKIVEELLPHYGAECPIAVIHRAS